LNWDIVDAMFTVKELMLSPAGTVAEPLDVADGEVAGLDEPAEVDVDGVVEDDELDDEQPAAAREAATTAVSPTQPSRRTPRDVRLPCEREDRPPPLLIPSPIPNFPSLRSRSDESMRDTIQELCPFEEEARAGPRTSAITGWVSASLRSRAPGSRRIRNTTVYFAHSLVRAAGGVCETRSV
jgi:hypothetical protein